MILRLFRRTPPVDTIACLYGTIVAQARTRAFYRVYGVPDTVNGRLEMIMLHAVLILQRLEHEPAAVRALGQGIFDRFCRDMDASMREMGVGDLAVPRKMRRIGDAFYARQATYGSALAESDNARLSGLLRRNVFAGTSQHDGAERLATYSREAIHLLAKQEGFMRGELTFPDPDLV